MNSKVGGSIPSSDREIACLKIFHKHICSWVENECCCLHTDNISNVNFTLNTYMYILIIGGGGGVFKCCIQAKYIFVSSRLLFSLFGVLAQNH